MQIHTWLSCSRPHRSSAFICSLSGPQGAATHTCLALCVSALATPAWLEQWQAPAFCSAGALHVTRAPAAVLCACTAGWASVSLAWTWGLVVLLQQSSCQSYWQLLFFISSVVAQLVSLNIAGIQSRGHCFLMHSHTVGLICNITKVNLANLTWNNNFGKWEAYCSKIRSRTE